MTTTSADRIWNRAAGEAGGESPGPGDRALASLLLVHGLVMNGGVHHALEIVDADELAAAADGFAYFGLFELASFFRGAPNDPILSSWTDHSELAANRRYEEWVPDDAHLVARFRDILRDRIEDFAPLDQV